HNPQIAGRKSKIPPADFHPPQMFIYNSVQHIFYMFMRIHLYKYMFMESFQVEGVLPSSSRLPNSNSSSGCANIASCADDS
ncbi:hypothetical protein, partial [Agrobacterium salinitolerans]|uniref:hypothetical protein n=2 Tax=Agrobacterium TaxID=357 RepID=UPI00195BE59C